MKTTSLVFGIAAAAVAGVAIGMLLAPEKGSDLQKKVRDNANRWMDEVTKFLSNTRDLALASKEDAEDEVAAIKSNLKPIAD